MQLFHTGQTVRVIKKRTIYKDFVFEVVGYKGKLVEITGHGANVFFLESELMDWSKQVN